MYKNNAVGNVVAETGRDLVLVTTTRLSDLSMTLKGEVRRSPEQSAWQPIHSEERKICTTRFFAEGVGLWRDDGLMLSPIVEREHTLLHERGLREEGRFDLEFSADHALNCKIGGYPCIRHNQVRDLLASLMKEVCTDVRTEPELQPLTGEVFNRATTITTDEARLDIEARGFWECRQECTMFDVRVFNPCADSCRHAPLSALYRRQEQLKRNAYEERVRQVEKASFVPLVFTTSGSASPAATVVLKKLAARLDEARDLSYSTVMGWLRCWLSFCLLRCAVMCFRSSRSRRTTALDNAPNLACSAARVNFAAWVCLFHFVRSTSCLDCLPSFLLSLRLVPLFCFVIFFIYCLLFVSLFICYWSRVQHPAVKHQRPPAKTTNSNCCDRAVAQVKLSSTYPNNPGERTCTASTEQNIEKRNQINKKHYWK